MKTPNAYDDFGLSMVWRPTRAVRILDQHVGGGGARGGGGKLSQATKARLNRVVRKAPEAVVKVSGRTKDAGHLKAHLDYITRNGKVEAQTDFGPMKGRAAVEELHADWALDEKHLGRSESLRRAPLSVNMVLSMPKAVDRERFRDAVTDFVDKELRPRVDVVVCFHHDTAHPHAHVTVRGRDREGKTFNPRKADLHNYRERFAECLRHRGIEAEATPRSARGVGMRGQRAAVRQMEKRNVTSKVTESAYRQAMRDHEEGQGARPWEKPIEQRHKAVKAVYETAARSLAVSSDPTDRLLAERVAAFTKALPADRPLTRRDHYAAVLARRVKEQDTPGKAPSTPER